MKPIAGQEEILYDNRGRIYRSLSYAVNPSTGAVGNSLKTDFWYDALGNVIKQRSPGSGAFQKMVYDGINRLTREYFSFDAAETDTDYGSADDVTGDTVMRQFEFNYDAGSNLLQQTRRDRFHDATGTGDLVNPGTQPTARVSYTAFWPDPVGRERARADYGTNAGAAFSRPEIVPSRTDTVLVTTTNYNNAGEAFEFVDPKAKKVQLSFDHAGRMTKRVDNYVDGLPGGGQRSNG